MNFENDTLQLQAVRIKDKYYIREVGVKSYNSTNLLALRYDGLEAKEAFLRDWCVIDKVPESITHLEYGERVNPRFELIDKSLATDKIPSVLKPEQIIIRKGCEDDDIWEGEYANLKSLYVYCFDRLPDTWKPVKFTFDIVFEVDKVSTRPAFKYELSPKYNAYASNKTSTPVIDNASIKHQVLASLVYPEILNYEMPCYLSSKDSYEIIRAHVKRNIDAKYAKITSDYDFCFTVEKVIPLAKPFNSTFTIKKGRRNISEVRLQTTKQVKIFEMTHDESKYKGYTVLEGFSADNEAKLQEKIDTYLEQLMQAINAPCRECPTCEGVGVIFGK